MPSVAHVSVNGSVGIASFPAVKRYIRVKKEDSAFVYFILESYEGITSYSTLDHQPGAPYRDMELGIPVDFEGEVQDLLERLGDLAHEIPIEAVRG